MRRTPLLSAEERIGGCLAILLVVMVKLGILVFIGWVIVRLLLHFGVV